MICHVVFLLRDFVWWQFCSNLLVFRIMSCGIVTLLSFCQASDLNFESDWVRFFVSCFVSIVFLLFSIYFFSWFVFPLIPIAGAFGSSRHIVYLGCNAHRVRATKDQWKIKYNIKMAQILLYRLSQKMHVPRRFSPNQWDDLAFRWEHVRHTFLPQFFCIRTKNRSSSIGFFGKWARLLNRWNGWLLTSLGKILFQST